MKLLNVPVFVGLSLLTFTAALPVDIHSVSQEFQLRDVVDEKVDLSLEKREIKALTVLFQNMNNTAGISLIKGACTNGLTQPQIIKFVANLIEQKSLETLLKVADTSGLGLDLVLMILTHYETIPGITKIIKQYKSGLTSSFSGLSSSNSSNPNSSNSSFPTFSSLSSPSPSSSSSGTSSGGLLGGLLGGIGSLFGLKSSPSSSSTSLFSSGASSSISPTITATTSSSSLTLSPGGLLGSLLGGVGSVLGLSSGLVSPSSSVTTATASVVVSLSTVAVGLTDLTGSTTIAPTIITTATPITPGTTTSSTAAATSTSNPVSNTINTITGLFGFVKREDLDYFLLNENMHELLRRNNFPVDNMLSDVYARSHEDQELAKRDALDFLYSQIINIIGTNSNMEDIAESLDKSGLAINVVYNAIVDSGWYNFDVNLVRYLVKNNIITALGLLSALFSLGIVLSIVGDIIGNLTYLKYVINFVLAILSGKVDILSLITALF